MLRVDIQLGAGPLALAPSEEDRQADLKAIDVRIERFKAQIQLYPERKAQLEAKIAELEQRKKSAAPPPPAPGTSVLRATFVAITAGAGENAEARKLVDAYDAAYEDFPDNIMVLAADHRDGAIRVGDRVRYIPVDEALAKMQVRSSREPPARPSSARWFASLRTSTNRSAM